MNQDKRQSSHNIKTYFPRIFITWTCEDMVAVIVLSDTSETSLRKYVTSIQATFTLWNSVRDFEIWKERLIMINSYWGGGGV